MGGKRKYTKNDKLTVNGLLMEPLNPSYTLSTVYYMKPKDRKKILGKLSTFNPLTP